jgi:hypothetical protein
VNALPLVRIQDLENMSFSDWRAKLEAGWQGEYARLAGGPFLHGRFLVRAEDASMEPMIPKDALCEFHTPSDEGLENKVVLAGLKTYAKRTSNVVMKRYQRFLFVSSGAVGETTKIILASENKTYPSLELREGVDTIEILGVFDRIFYT